jgi:hypothetical protein
MVTKNEGGKGNDTKDENPFGVFSPVFKSKPQEIVIQLVVVHSPDGQIELKPGGNGEGNGPDPGESPEGFDHE